MLSSVSKNYLVTGAGRGIGRGISRLLLQQGHRVLLVDTNEEELTNTTTLLSQSHTSGQDFDSVQCNLQNPSEILSAAERARSFFSGHLDCLLNNAAYTSGVGAQHLRDLPLETWTQSLSTNLTAPMLMSQACLSLLQTSPSRSSGEGNIINISSTRATMSELNNEAYSASKAGLLGLSQSMAVSLAEQGIRVNALLLGWIHVADECKAADQSGQAWEEGLSKEDQAWHLTGRVGKVEDVFRAVQFLVDAEFVSGAEVVVDGGVTRKMVYPE